MNWEWKLIDQNCTGCGICVDVCSLGALEMTVEMAYPRSVPGKCEGCRDCIEECPFDAIELVKLT